jgi:beta-galactosidase/beta-glucuronidase
MRRTRMRSGAGNAEEANLNERELPRPEYPRPRLRRREWVNLNGEWEFGAGPEPRFDRRILVPFAPQAELSGIGERNPGDRLWYRRRFAAPEAARLLLHFGAVDYRAVVHVNRVEVARHEGGHTPFAADLSGVAGGADNELVVMVEDPMTDATLPRGKQSWTERNETIFYTPTAGIWQTVWLEPLPDQHISGLRVLPDLGGGAVELEVGAGGPVEVVVTLDGAEAGRWDGPAGRCRIELDPVVAWSPEAPHLYDLRIVSGGDEVSSYFGLRTVETRGGRFLLNGEPYIQRLVLDQGYFPGGLLTAPGDADLRRDIELARQLGFNGARKHQKVEDPRWLYWADQLGFLVWGEMANFLEHSPAAERRLVAEWRAAVERDRDHPSIVAWVPENESFGLQTVDDATRVRLLDELYEVTKRLDGTRPVVSNDGERHAKTDLCTLHDYSGPELLARRYRRLEIALGPDAGRPQPPYLPTYAHRGEPVIVSEFGGVQLSGGGGWAYGEVEGPAQLLETYKAQVEALLDPGPVEGFCYTQLTDVEQERNGLLTFARHPKVEPALIRAVTQTAKLRRHGVSR